MTKNGYRGVVTKSEVDNVLVRLLSFDKDSFFGPCLYPKQLGVPALGAKCLVTFDDDQTPVIVWFEGEEIDSGAPPELYVQIAAPVNPTLPYIWIELGNPVGGWTMWFEEE